MNRKSHSIEVTLLLATAGLIVLGACAATGDDSTQAPGPGPEEGGTSDAAPVDALPDVELDAERPLSCGGTGFCETKLPKDDYGAPLSLRGVWVVDSNDVWTVSVNGVVLHYDGTSWSTSYRTNHELYSVWGTGTDTWVGGEAGLLLHRSADGNWSRVETNHAAPIRAISGTGPGDVWLMSRGASVDHFDGTMLTNHPIDVPDLRVTTVFGRAGLGMFAAGYVPAPPDLPEEHSPYVIALSTAPPAIFNTSLSGQKGFMPVAGVVTDAPNADQRILITAYRDMANSYQPAYCLLGKDTIHGCDKLVEDTIGHENGEPLPLQRPPVSAPRPDKFVVPYEIGAVFQWDGTTFVKSSLNMGPAFVPAAVNGVHNNAKDTWIVGDGFALKGATP